MSAPSQASNGRAELARTLRDLRLRRWPGKTVPQRTLAEGLGGNKPLSLSLISSWENENNPTAPPPARLHDYATFFVTEQSVIGGRGRLVPEDELTADEITDRDKLYEKLLALHTEATDVPMATASAPIRFNWRYPRGASIRIVCGKLDPAEGKHSYTNADNWNYTDLLTYADLDAMVELFGHLRKANPDCDIRFVRSDRLIADDVSSHLILLGGRLVLNKVTKPLLEKAQLPVRQREDEDGEFADKGEIFEVSDGDKKIKYTPVTTSDTLMEDVGLLARVPNPNNSLTTLTICSGVFAAGVYGAVRTLTDDTLRKQNESYLASRYAGADQFAILMRVPVLSGTVLTPDLQNETTRLYEWPPDAARAA